MARWPGSLRFLGLQHHIPGHKAELGFFSESILLPCCQYLPCHLRNKLTKITFISSFVSAVLNTVKSIQKIHIYSFTQNLAYPVHRTQLKAVLYSAQSSSQGEESVLLANPSLKAITIGL